MIYYQNQIVPDPNETNFVVFNQNILGSNADLVESNDLCQKIVIVHRGIILLHLI